MSEIKERLFTAFRADHDALESALNDIRTHLLAANVAGVKADARYINETCGAHIAFEEKVFYPTLREFLSDAEMAHMYREHADGLVLIEELIRRSENRINHPAFIRYCVNRIEDLQAHVADCGDLFGILAGIPTAKAEAFYYTLLKWRAMAPKWSEFNRARCREQRREMYAV